MVLTRLILILTTLTLLLSRGINSCVFTNKTYEFINYLDKSILINCQPLDFKICDVGKHMTLEFGRCNLSNVVTWTNLLIREKKTKSWAIFRISNSNLTNLNRNFFKGLENIEIFKAVNNTINNVPEDLIYDLKKLEVIDIDSSVVVPQKFFAKAQNLKSIAIAGNLLPKNTTGIFRNQKGLKNLNMARMAIRIMDSKIFEGLYELEVLDLSTNSISSIPINLFHDLHNLKSLDLRRNYFEAFPLGLLDKSPNLESINLGENIRMSTLPDNFLSNKKFLRNVTISNCNLTTLPSLLFNNSNALEMIDLSNNHLDTLPNDLLSNKSKLRVLNLEKNYLKTLPLDFFIHLGELELLNLNDNYLQLTSDNFQEQINLRVLLLANNSLKALYRSTFQNLQKLQILDLSYNQITLKNECDRVQRWFLSSQVSTLEVLNLEGNNISKICWTWKLGLSKLRELNLSNNSFTKLTFWDIDFGQSEITINLEHNLIKNIDMSDAEVETQLYLNANNKIYHKPEKKITVRLNNNPLNCSCDLYDLYRYFDLTMDPKVRNIFTLQTVNLFCQSPKHMAGKQVETIKSKTFVCEYDYELCLENATCYYKPYDDVLMMDLTKKGLLEAPDLKAFKNNQSSQFKKLAILLQHNKIREMPQPGMGYEIIHELDLSNNLIDHIEWIPENLKVLQLHDNALTHLSDKTLSSFNHSRIRNLSLYNNPWSCNCSTVNFLKFIQNQFEKFYSGPQQNITCKDTTQKIFNLAIDELCQLPTSLIIFLCVFVAFIAITSAILTFLYNHYNMEIKVWLFAHQQCLWLVTEEEIDRKKIYDAFISYSHQDEDFLIPELIEKLEQGPNPYKLCLHFRDWQPGEFIAKNIFKSVADSRKTIVILSKNFLKSEWGKMEFRVAHKQALEENRARVIIILIGEIPMDNLDAEIKAYLSTNTYLKWGDPWFWDKLRYALPHSRVNNYIHEKVRFDREKMNVFIEPGTTSIQSTPVV